MRIRSLFGLALGAVAILSGCGGEARDATTKELASLTSEIARLRAEQSSIAERLSALERAKESPAPAASAPATKVDPAAPAAPPAQPSLEGDRPSLDVVRLGPSEAPEDDDADADGPRTVLRSSAQGIVVEETGPGGAVSRSGDPLASKKPAARKSDRTDRKKTASVSAP